MSEPAWMQKISNTSVCNFFYAWFVVYAVLFALAVALAIGTFFSMKKLGAVEIALNLQVVLTSLIAGSFMMFHYIVCDRALLPLAEATKTKPF